jgi:chemosensory pili system protein ChpA (sensor histidine kinase/response regulator)
MSASSTALPSNALRVLRELLDQLVQQLAPDQASGGDPSLLVALLDAAHTEAGHARLHGVPQLLRTWTTAMAQRAKDGQALGEEEQVLAWTWFIGLQCYCQGELDEGGQLDLLDQFAAMPGLPPVPPRLHVYLREVLRETRVYLMELIAELAITPVATDGDTLPELEVGLFDAAVAQFVEASAPAAESMEQLFVSDGGDEVGSGPIWISREELQLALDAVGEQILPSVCALAECSADQRAHWIGELEFNLGLVGSAMGMLGTPALAHGIVSVQAAVSGPAPPPPEVLANWAAAMIAFLEHPDASGAETLALFSRSVDGLDDDWCARLLDEAARIRIGNDPALRAQRKALATAEDVALEIAADVLPSVREGMLRELPGHAERLGAAIRRLLESGDTAPIDEARRIAHTLKGDANTVGVRGLANLTHSLEDLLIELQRHPERLVPELGRALDQAADCVEEIADHLLGRGVEPQGVQAIYQSILDWSNAVVDDDAPVAEIQARRGAGRADPLPADGAVTTAHQAGVEPPAATEAEANPARTATLTVSAELLDELQRLAGETLVMARQIEQRLARLEGMHRDQAEEARTASLLLGKLDDLVSLRGAALQSTALRGGGTVDPLELDQYNELHVVSRRLLEAHADHHEYQHRFDALLVELEDLRSQQEAVHAELQRGVQRARMVPFDQVGGRLQRIVRQTARQLGRAVELKIAGAETQLDAELLDRIVEPLAHLLRNAIDHGLEDAPTRRAAGKPETGSIEVRVGTVGDSIEITVADDGRGLNTAAIRAKGVLLGVIAPEASPSDDELMRLILSPGFTTRSEATQVSGRGIGMDVVNQRVIDLRGQLAIESVAGRGLTVRLRLPLSQTMANIIIAHGHGLIIGAVAGSVERVHGFSTDELAYADDGEIRLAVDGELLPLYPIESLYGRTEGRLSLPTANGLGLVVRSARGQRVVVSVDRIGEVSNVIVKPISPFLPPVPSVRGMTLLGDGRLAAVVDMGTLIDALDAQSRDWRFTDVGQEPARLPRVVVADDSLSVRRALTQLMEDAGFEVAAARDGLEALELVNAAAPALVLLDLEMPKLNGLEVTRFMRGRAQTRQVPVLMITSRASDKYRAQAQEAGVTMMLGKPYSEDDLILTVRQLMAESMNEPALENP